MDVAITDRTEILKALTQEYVSARQEVIAHVQLYKSQERYGATLVATLGILIPLLIGAKITGQGIEVLELTPWAVLVALFATSTIVFHMYFSSLAILFALQVLAERCVLLENQINKYLDGKYFIWERLAKLIWAKDGLPTHKMPDKTVAIFSILLLLVFGVIIPVCALLKIFLKPQGTLFNSVAGLYVTYLFAVVMIGAINFKAMANVRDECHLLFKNAIESGQKLEDALLYNANPSIFPSSALVFAAALAIAIVGAVIVVIMIPYMVALFGT